MSEYIHNALLPVLDAPRTREEPLGEWLTIKEAIRLTGLSENTIVRRAAAGIVAKESDRPRARYSRRDLEGMRLGDVKAQK